MALTVQKIGEISRLRCPKCGKANVFHKTKYPFISVPKMKEVCDHCGYRFNREPGYFLGAMYVSYGLAVIEGILAFLITPWLIFGISTINLVLVTVGVILLLAMWNYRMARVIWMN